MNKPFNVKATVFPLTSTSKLRALFQAPKMPKRPIKIMKIPLATTPPRMDRLDTYDPVLAHAATAIKIMPQAYNALKERVALRREGTAFSFSVIISHRHLSSPYLC